MKHKHYDMIVAWANGQQIQIRETGGNWEDIDIPSWINGCQYRIKPEQEPVKCTCGYSIGHPLVNSCSCKPRKPWQGLTDEELNLIYAEPQTHVGQYARAIEAKLKEKNTTN
jgi:hypothetical protein